MVRTIISAAVSGESSKYEDAVKKLNTLQSNAQTLEKIRKEKDKRAHLNIPRMEKFAERVGIQVADMDKLNVIHVSGTKGKGSTCAFCESILRHHGYKTGFFSSPHLVEVRERFCIDGRPIEREKFATYFWDVYNQLQMTKGDDIENNMPNYFGFLVVMAFHVFLQEKVDVAIMEVGIGGQYDSTNVVRNPLVCGVTSLGLDHVSVLGTSIDKIAWHKAGIFKPHVPAFTAPQVPEAMVVLKSRAEDIGSSLSVCPELGQYGSDISLGIQGPVQEVNASLGLQLCNTWMEKYKEKSRETTECETSHRNGDVTSTSTLSDTLLTSTICDIPIASPFHLSKQCYIGLEQCRWLGRNQKLEEQGSTFYLDGAHTIESIEQCVNWFEVESSKEKSKLQGNTYRVLIFNTTGNRDTTTLLLPLMRCHFDAVLFCPNLAYIENMSFDQTNNTVTKEMQLDRCAKNQETWQELTKNQNTTKNENGEILDAAGGHHAELNGKCEENGLSESPVCGKTSDETHLQFLPSISHCVNWVRHRQWKCTEDKSLRGIDSKTVINGEADGVNGPVNCDTNMDINSKNTVQDGTGDFMEDSGAHNGVTKHLEVPDREPHVQVLVTGSLHLVGGALKVLWDNQS